MKSLRLGYWIWKKLQINRASTLGRITLKYIPVDVKDEQLEQKVTDIFSHLNINISKQDIEDCHRLGKSSITVKFVNRKVCKDALEKKFEVNILIDNSKFGFKRENKLLFVKI